MVGPGEGLNALLLMHDLYGASTDVYFPRSRSSGSSSTTTSATPSFTACTR